MFDLERAKREGCLTKDGRKVRIIGERNTQGRGGNIIALIEDQTRSEWVATFYGDGLNSLVYRDHNASAWQGDCDLVNLPHEHTVYVVSNNGVSAEACETEAAAICKVRFNRKRGFESGYAPVAIPLNR